MANHIYTLDQFNSFKEGVLGRNIGRKKVNISELQIVSDNIVKYAGLSFKLDKVAFNALLRMLGISKAFRQKMIKDFGNNFVDKLIEIMAARSGKSDNDAVMLVDIKTKTILNFIHSDVGMIGNQSYLNEVQNIIDKYNLDVTGLHDRGNGGFSISTVSNNSDWGLQGLKDEVFKFGVNFENDPVRGTRLSPFNQRLVCTNGMVTTRMLGSTNLINTKDSWEHFFNTVDSLSKRGFRPEEFASSVKESMQVKASVHELESARNLIKSNTIMDDMVLETYMPWMETEAAYKATGQDLSMFSIDKKKNAKSSETYWDLINHITYISSNVTGIGLKNADRLQMYAGELLSKTPDTSNLVSSPF